MMVSSGVFRGGAKGACALGGGEEINIKKKPPLKISFWSISPGNKKKVEKNYVWPPPQKHLKKISRHFFHFFPEIHYHWSCDHNFCDKFKIFVFFLSSFMGQLKKNTKNFFWDYLLGSRGPKMAQKVDFFGYSNFRPVQVRSENGDPHFFCPRSIWYRLSIV